MAKVSSGVFLGCLAASALVVAAAGGARAGTQPTSVTLTLAAPIVNYGNEETEVASVSVAGASGTPTGTVAVTAPNGSVFCTATLTNGQGSCAPFSTWSYPGQFTVTGSYSGDASFAPSASAPQTATVIKDPTSTTLSLSRSAAIYGDETSVVAQAAVAAEYSGGSTLYALNGRLTITDSLKTSCEISYYWLICRVPFSATLVPAGVTTISASYSGNVAFDPSAAPVRTLTVSKASSRSTLTLSATRITYGHENSERLTVKVSPEYAGTPTGAVTIWRGKQAVCKIALSTGKGSCALTARELPTGVWKLIARYAGSQDFTGSSSASKTLTVVK